MQEIEINGLKKCALDLLFMWSMHPPACFRLHGSKVEEEFNGLLISLKHLISLQTAMAMQGKNPMCNHCGFQ